METQPFFRVRIGTRTVARVRDVEHAIAIARLEHDKALAHNRDANGMLIDASELDREPADTTARIMIRHWGALAVDIAGILGPDTIYLNPERWARSVRLAAEHYTGCVRLMKEKGTEHKALSRSIAWIMDPDRRRKAFMEWEDRGII